MLKDCWAVYLARADMVFYDLDRVPSSFLDPSDSSVYEHDVMELVHEIAITPFSRHDRRLIERRMRRGQFARLAGSAS